MRARHRFSPFALIACATLCASAALGQATAIWKWRTDLGNTGWNPNEKILNRTNVGSSKFGKLFERKLDGQVYAQPLYVAGITIPNKGVHNVVYVCTEHNSVYAFDAEGGASTIPLWQRTMGQPVTTDVVGCYDLYPEYGITSTPVIDVANKVMYLTAKTLENGQQTWRIHALDISTGDELPNWGKVITASFINTFGFTVSFTPEIQLNRCGLTLANGRVYIAFGAHCDIRITEYRGWIFSYNTANAKEPPQVYCVSPNSDGSRESAAGIWSSGAAPVIDANGDLYVMTGNGQFDVDLGGGNMGDSVVKIATSGGAGLSFSGQPQDYFTPSNQQNLTNADADLGSGGIILAPSQAGANTPNLILGGGKDGLLRLLDITNLGGFNGRVNPNAPDNAIQEVSFPNGFWSSPAYFGGDSGHYIYMNAVGDVLRQYRFSINGFGDISLLPFAAQGPGSGYPSSTPVVSSDGGTAGTGVVWILNRNDNALHAYDADNVVTELWNSNAAGTRDLTGDVVKFTVPMVANGRVYVGGDGKMTVFGTNAAIIERTDHYALAGPTVVNRGQRAIFQISSLDVNGIPSPTMGTVTLEIQPPSGPNINIGPIRFAGASTKLFSRIFDPAGTYTLIAAKGTSKQKSYTVTVKPTATDSGADHFSVVAPLNVAQNVPFGFIVVAKDKNDRQVNYTGTVAVSSTKADGTYVPAPNVVFNAQKTATGTATLSQLGDSVMIATDGVRTGNVVVTVKEASHVSGKAIPGDWAGSKQLKATVRLLDPFDHTLVVFTKTVTLQSDFSFSVDVPSGVFDVSVKIDHWLQQIIKKVDTNSTPTLIFNGPDGTGLINGDTNNDNKVNATDVNNVTGDMGGPPSGTRGLTDLNGDGTVDATDLAIVNKNNGRVGDK